MHLGPGGDPGAASFSVRGVTRRGGLGYISKNIGPHIVFIGFLGHGEFLHFHVLSPKHVRMFRVHGVLPPPPGVDPHENDPKTTAEVQGYGAIRGVYKGGRGEPGPPQILVF